MAEEDPRTSCRRCQYGGLKRCPDGYPLPFELLHHCPYVRLRDPRGRDANPYPVEPWPKDAPRRVSHRACREWIEQVHADDRKESSPC